MVNGINNSSSQSTMNTTAVNPNTPIGGSPGGNIFAPIRPPQSQASRGIDKIEISQDAKDQLSSAISNLMSDPSTAAKINEVKENISNGFYDNPAVLRAVAQRISKEANSSS